MTAVTVVVATVAVAAGRETDAEAPPGEKRCVPSVVPAPWEVEEPESSINCGTEIKGGNIGFVFDTKPQLDATVQSV